MSVWKLEWYTHDMYAVSDVCSYAYFIKNTCRDNRNTSLNDTSTTQILNYYERSSHNHTAVCFSIGSHSFLYNLDEYHPRVL